MDYPTSSRPLADRIRPQTLEEFVGQSHLIGVGKPIYMGIRNHATHSIILWGPPGVGKTTLAKIIAGQTNMPFHALSAVSANKNDIRTIVDNLQYPDTPLDQLIAQEHGDSVKHAKSAILFLDEIHRFNKAQQDFLLPYVEDGTIILIGATTENPSFEVISALLSRCQVFVLEPLNLEEIAQIIERGVQELDVALDDEAREFLAQYSNGDARQALNLLDTTASLYAGELANKTLTVTHLKTALQSKHLRYDKQSDEHYNTISAYIKSMRASDVDAALYYLARMVDAGEDPKFIARRMVIFASEDIGMAQPTALVVANEVFRAVETIGYPECQINLAHGTVYMATAKKDRSACDAYFRALDDVKQSGNLPIPLEIRNAPTPLMKELGYGDSYQPYSRDSHLPEQLRNKKYYLKSE